jgi:chromosome segregation ATPase
MMGMTELNGSAMNGSAMNGISLDEEARLRSEYQRLQAELTAAKERVAASQQRIAVRDAEIQGALRDELHLAQDELANLAARHESDLEQIRRDTASEVTRILASGPELPQVQHGE